MIIKAFNKLQQSLGKSLEIIIKVRPFISIYNWKGIIYSSGKYDWKTFEKSNPTIPLNVLYAKKMKTYRAYNSKHNSNHESQTIFLMIPNGERRHYLANC